MGTSPGVLCRPPFVVPFDCGDSDHVPFHDVGTWICLVANVALFLIQYNDEYVDTISRSCKILTAIGTGGCEQRSSER